jgi:hypothetical protein
MCKLKAFIDSHNFFRGIVVVGLSDATDNSWVGRNSNSYAILIIGHYCYRCWPAGEIHHFELPVGANQPEMKEYGNVYGCGLVLDPDNKLAIFFTLNGQLLGEVEILRINKEII